MTVLHLTLMYPSTALAVLGVIIIAFLLSQRLRAKRSPLRPPPGPAKLPIIGNLLYISPDKPWKTFAEWGDRWGEIVSFNVLGETTIVLNSYRAAVEVLEKKSLIYSDRPTMMMAGEIIGWSSTVVLTRYGDRFRTMRRMLHSLLGTRSAVTQFHQSLEHNAMQLLESLMITPDRFRDHLCWSLSSLTLNIAYGYVAKDCDDPIVQVARAAMDDLSTSTRPGAYLVDFFPALRRIPNWFPATNWKAVGRGYASTFHQMVERPWNEFKQQLNNGNPEPSFCAANSGRSTKLSSEHESVIKATAASIYAGGADTIVSALETFVMAMVLHPDIQQSAQEEVDALIGSKRLPTFSDRSELPYVEALIMEVLRWNAITPLGVPHRVIVDDIHDGYHIPKDSTVFANVWKMLRDPCEYHNPLCFKPERFLGDHPELDPRNCSFGFGRRLCPGLQLADAALYINCATMLAAFNFSPAVDRDGKPCKPDLEFVSGMARHPKPFKCSIQPRSLKSRQLISMFRM